MNSCVVDVHFLEHIVDCIKRQKTISEEPVISQVEFQNTIDVLIDQCESLIEDARLTVVEEHHLYPEILLVGTREDLEKYVENKGQTS